MKSTFLKSIEEDARFSYKIVQSKNGPFMNVLKDGVVVGSFFPSSKLKATFKISNVDEFVIFIKDNCNQIKLGLIQEKDKAYFRLFLSSKKHWIKEKYKE